MGASRDAEPFLRYSTWLTARYGEKTYRVSVDAGFSCPVRERGVPCAYCDAGGSRAPYLGDRRAVADQIGRAIGFLRSRYAARTFLLYFQAFSNTHAPVETLRQVYDFGLEQAAFRGLIVATRPDCIDEDRAKLLAEYRRRGLDVWAELGLQSANDATLRRVNRGHTRAQFDEAVRLLARHGVGVAAHLILGLPGEGRDEAIASAEHISRLPVGGVKFHNFVAVEGTALYDEYLAGKVRPPDSAQYRELLIASLEHLRPDIVVMRLTCDPPRDARCAPSEFPDKATVYRRLCDDFRERGTTQGIYWSHHADQR